MPSQYSQNLRIELIASGEQGNTWGNTTNNNLGTLIEQAISGYRSISTVWSGNACTLVALNGANDQARNMFLEIPSSVSLSAEGQLTAPTVPKMYVIKNNSSGGFAVRIKTGSSTTSCLIPNGTTKVVVCDGTEFYEATTAAADFYIANAPTLGSQATNKTYVDTQDGLRLKRDGSQNMTGELVLSAGTAPVNALGAVSRQYVQSTFLPLTGGTLSGGLTLPSSVGGLTTWSAVPKTYVDSLVPGIASASSLGLVKGGGNVSIAGDGTLSVSGVGAGTVTNVSSGTVGVISVANPTTTPVISISLASASSNGYLSATDWGTFNGKMSNSGAAVVSALGYTPYNAANIGSASVSFATSAGTSSLLNGFDQFSFVFASGSTMTGNLAISSGSTPNQLRTGIFTDGSGNFYPGIVAHRNATGSNYSAFIIGQTNNDANPTTANVVRYNLTALGAHLFTGNLSVAGNLSATGTKPFCIDHPILEDKKLYHVAVEAPRNDLLYRGKVKLAAGQATVNLDSESRMTAGTFVALTQNVEVVGLNNASGFGRIRASAVVNGQFTIYAEEADSTDEVNWVVMAERNDTNMHGNTLCDEYGRLVPEQPKPEE